MYFIVKRLAIRTWVIRITLLGCTITIGLAYYVYLTRDHLLQAFQYRGKLISCHFMKLPECRLSRLPVSLYSGNL